MAARYGGTEPRAGGARRRVRERRRRGALDAGDARRGAGAAADRAGPDRGRGRSAGDGGARAGRVRHRRRRGRDEGAAAGLAGRGDRRRAASPGSRRRRGPSGRWRSTTPMRPTGWWPRSTRAATWSRQLIRQVDPMVAFAAVHASQRQGAAGRAGGGALRAGAGRAPRRVPGLEDQMALMTVGRVRRRRQSGPARRAGLGDHRADARSGGAGRAASSRCSEPDSFRAQQFQVRSRLDGLADFQAARSGGGRGQGLGGGAARRLPGRRARGLVGARHGRR